LGQAIPGGRKKYFASIWHLLEIKGTKISSKSIKKETKIMKDEVWKLSWSDLWAKLGPGQTLHKRNGVFGVHFGSQNPLKTVIFGIVF